MRCRGPEGEMARKEEKKIRKWDGYEKGLEVAIGSFRKRLNGERQLRRRGSDMERKR